eukprot:21335-Heterococcus_DN1.PRE.1
MQTHHVQPLSQEDASFVPGKQLTQKDMILIDMLSGNEDKGVCWVITDPQLPDNPIIYSSEGFCAYTQYLKSEIEGQNCRFLQGQGTDPKDVERIREAIKEQRDANVCLLNYRKDGTTFVNQFFLCPLRDATGTVVYYLGVQTAVPKRENGQCAANPGWYHPSCMAVSAVEGSMSTHAQES